MEPINKHNDPSVEGAQQPAAGPAQSSAGSTATEPTQPVAQPQPTESAEQTTGGSSTESNTVQGAIKKVDFSVVGYILPFLFFLPLLDDKLKHDTTARFHANQQLILLVVMGAVYLLHQFVLSPLGMFGYYLMRAISLAIIALMGIGAYNAYKEQMKELPFIGQFHILK